MCFIEGASYNSTESECSVTALLSGTLVVLRALEREDLTNLHKWQNDEEIMRLARSFPDHVISKEALEAEFARELKGEDTGRRAPTLSKRSPAASRSAGRRFGFTSSNEG